MPLTGLMYHEFQTYAPGAIPAGIQAKAMVDVADTGEDFLCAVAYKPTEVGAYVVGVVYTQARAEVTELLVASLCSDHLVKLCRCESNNGGQFFKRNVEALCRKAKNFFTTFKTFVQRKNKESRILNNSSAVNNYWLMPEDWAKRWPDFHKALTRHLKAGKNEHDDGPDCLTAAFEHEEIRSQKGYKKRN